MLKVDINSVSIFTNKKQKTLLQNIKFEIEKGKIYTILGKNGSGKSTLIKSLTALLPTNQYEVIGKTFYGETDLLSSSEGNLREIRKNKIRYLFQDVSNSLDPLKKLKYYFDLSEVNPIKIEEHLIYFLLPTYKKLSTLHSYELSGGMAQRFLIVLALLANPNLIILDEPTSGVDYAVTNLILLKLKEFIKEKDKAVIVVTQDINFALKSSDYIAFLSNETMTQFYQAKDFMGTSINKEMQNFINSFKVISDATA